MTAIVYLHGFLSSPASSKARNTEAWLADHHPDCRFICPELSSYPAEAMAQIESCMRDLKPEHTGVIGSSLGGFWATNLIERGLASRAVLVNPAVAPQDRFHEFTGQTLQSYYSQRTYCLSDRDLQDLVALDFPAIQRPERYWLMVQTGDETLNYRQATDKYRECKQTVEEGGSHTFEGFTRWLPEIYEFLTDNLTDNKKHPRS